MASLNKMADLAGDRILAFRVADLVCAVDASAAREILPVQPATRVPGAADAVLGLVNVRGTVVTLVDGRQALQQRRADREGSMLLLDVGHRTVAFLVDEVVDLFATAEAELSDRAELPGMDPRVVRAVGRRGDLPFVLLDLEPLLAPIISL